MYNVRSYQKPRCFEKCTFFLFDECSTLVSERWLEINLWITLVSAFLWWHPACQLFFQFLIYTFMKEGKEEEGSSWKCKCWINLHIWLFYAIPKKVSMYFCLLIRVKLPFGFRDLKYLSFTQRIEDFAIKCLLILCKWSCEIFLMLIDVEEMDPQNSLSVVILAKMGKD